MSLQIVEKSGGDLSRVYGVTVPAKDLTDKLAAKIAEISPTLKLKGFRPGKVPAAHVKRLYGKSLMGEVIEQAINESSQQALDDAKLKPAGQPELKLESDMDKVMDGNADLSYELAVELMPDFEPIDLKTIKLKKPVYEPTEAEVDEAVAEIATQNKSYETRTGKSVKAKDGDMVVIDFTGSIDGVKFDGGAAQDAELVLGSGQFIPGFEDQLVGVKAGDETTVKVTFPADYQAENLKGKDAEFAIVVKDVRAPIDTKVDDALAEKVGLSSLETLKDALKTQLQGRYENMSRFKLKRALLDVLDEKHSFPLPPRMVDAEFDGIWSQVQADKDKGELSDEDKGKSETKLKEEYRKIAERRVRLGLVLAEIGRRQNIQISEQEVLNAARNQAMQYGPQAQQVFDYFRNNPNAMASLRAPLYEDKVVDAIFAEAKVTDQKVAKEKLLEEDELPEGYGG